MLFSPDSLGEGQYRADPRWYPARALARKARTPPPPRRPVQAPTRRVDPRDPGDSRRALMILAAIALLAAGLVQDVGALLVIEHAAMFTGMFAVMLARPDEYSRHRGAKQQATA